MSGDIDAGAALAVTDQGQAGVGAIALLPEAEFEQRLATLKKGQERIARVKRELMTEDVHYGIVPSTDKPTLYKPGAEVLCMIYSLRASFHHETEYGDGLTAPPVRVVTRCDLHLGDIDGPVVASAYGAANSWERKYRYRRGDRACPSCGNVGSVIKGKADYGGGWLCWAKKGGCGAKFEDKDPAIVEQAVGDIENPDQHDLENTLMKMSEKRAYIGATLRGTASSDLFSQDLEDAAPAGRAPTSGKGKGGRPAGRPAAPAEIGAEDAKRKTDAVRMLGELVRHEQGIDDTQAALDGDMLNERLRSLVQGVETISDLNSAVKIGAAHSAIHSAWSAALSGDAVTADQIPGLS